MIPERITVLDFRPRLANGKLDRGELAGMEPVAILPGAKTKPQEGTEKTVAAIWAEILDFDEIGADDNFFTLGGDSIQVMQMVARLRAAGFAVTAQQVFKEQTVAGLSSVLSPLLPSLPEEAPPMGDVPLTPIQKWFFYHHSENNARYCEAVVLAIRDIPLRSMQQALNAVIANHDALRLRFHRSPSGWSQTYVPSLLGCSIRYVDVSHASAEDLVGELRNSANPLIEDFDITLGPLAGAVYHDLGTGRWPVTHCDSPLDRRRRVVVDLNR